MHRETMYSRRMTEQALYILAALARAECHGYGIARDAEELSDGRVRLTAGTLYGALNRLTDDGLVEPAGEQQVQGRRRRYYRLTAAGADRARRGSRATAVDRRGPRSAPGLHPHRTGAGMSRRILELSLLAYPRQVRQRDGDHLLDLAHELADTHGARREAFGLLRGGLAERRRRRSPARKIAIAVSAAIGSVLVVLTWSAAAEPLQVEEEQYSCVGDCAADG